jgi:hypothetical protein
VSEGFGVRGAQKQKQAPTLPGITPDMHFLMQTNKIHSVKQSFIYNLLYSELITALYIKSYGLQKMIADNSNYSIAKPLFFRDFQVVRASTLKAQILWLWSSVQAQ